MNSTRARQTSHLALPALVLALALTPATSVAQQSGDAKQKRPSPYVQATKNAKKKTPAKSYSTEDLERMYGPTTPIEIVESPDSGSESDAKTPAEDKDPLKQLFEGEKQREEHEAQVAAASQKVAEAERKVAELERRSLAIRNPLLPRPEAPEEGAEEWNAADAQGRLEQNTAAIEAAKTELEKAREELATLQRATP